MSQPSSNKSNNTFIEDYYKTSGLKKIPKGTKRGDVLKNEEVFQLYKTPKKDKGKHIPHINTSSIDPKAILQADLLYLPDDNGFRFALVCVDISTGFTDAEPVKERDAETVLKAYKKITSREPLKNAPRYVLQTDGGAEFKSVFHSYVVKKGITHRVGKAGRSRQQAIVEQRNKVIGRALFYRMTAQEILTDQDSREWVKRLPQLIKVINAYHKDKNDKRKKKKEKAPLPPLLEKGTVLLSVGQPVRVVLDKPLSAFEKQIPGSSFRATDIRWSRKISHISNIILDGGQPPLYQVDDKKAPAYTRNQLQVVDVKTLQDPPASLVMEGNVNDYSYVVKTIIDKRKKKNKIEYLVVWKGFPAKKDHTWEPRADLLKFGDSKEKVDKYEKEKGGR